MRQNTFALTWLMLAATLLLAACATRLPPLVLTYSTAELESRLAERFPAQKRQSVLYELTLANPRVMLKPEAKRVAIALEIDLQFPLGGRGLKGSVTLSGKPRYDEATRGVFLEDGALDILDLERLPAPLQEPLRAALSGVARDTLAKNPIATVKEEQLKRGPVMLTPKKFDVVAEGLRIEFDVGARQ
jgi:hypothetical protein